MAGKRGGRDDQGRKIQWRPPGSTSPPIRITKDGRREQQHEYIVQLHQYAEDAFPVQPTKKINPNLLTDAQLIALVKELHRVDQYDWRANARPTQVQPKKYKTWLIMAGRGWGKTRCAAEAVREWCNERPGARVAVIAKGSRELRDVCFEGKSGLLSVFPPEEIDKYFKGLGDNKIILTNGAIIIGFSAEAPDAIRGQSFDAFWGDEFAAWPRHLAEDMLTQAWLTLRESKNPRAILATTPKRVKHVMDLIERAKKDKSVVVTGGKTTDNTKLTQEAMDEYKYRYSGTSIGRQELEGILLDTVDGALWKPEFIETARWGLNEEEDELPQFKKVLVGVDPSGSAKGDATGIVVIAITYDKRIFVLGCYSKDGTPSARYTAICMAAYIHQADEVLIEYNFGGDNTIFATEKQWQHLVQTGELPEGARMPRLTKSTLKGDKAVKAGPVAALYEQQHNVNIQRVRHVQGTVENGIDNLESQLISWAPRDKDSPNSLDALVIACRKAAKELGWEQTIGTASSKRRMTDGWRPW